MIKYLVVDVDGTLTDGGIYYDDLGNETKKFSVRDAAGFFAAHQVGIKIIVLTGRKCAATVRRMSELSVDYLYQDVKNKETFLQGFIAENEIKKEEIGYIGDDLNDISSMKLTGFIGCPADSCREVREVADYVSSVNGGSGAVRDTIEHMLRDSDQWDAAVSKIYGIGI